uniref:YTH domain-containing protein n=1 Tax=Arcella intermedia TaxID=1963864 RepID=A0A6B2LFH3_9EUKA
MKCLAYENLQIALQNHIWATQAHNEVKLNEAYKDSEVVLIFSINNSRHFQAYGRMVSRIGSKATSIWHCQQKNLGGVFSIEWISIKHLAFTETEHLHNPLNENKPVKISRDGQEIPEDIGYQLCLLIDNGEEYELTKYAPSFLSAKEEKPKMKEVKREEESIIITLVSAQSPRNNQNNSYHHEQDHDYDHTDNHKEYNNRSKEQHLPYQDYLKIHKHDAYQSHYQERRNQPIYSSRSEIQRRPFLSFRQVVV